LGKGGKEIWIQASYNPIMDMNGRPFKVVKYATDITTQTKARVDARILTEQVVANVQTVAAAAEEMLASINEISASMARAQDSIQEIVAKTQKAGELSENLRDSSNAMEDMVTMIRGIAEQVNLLALNATIEAARAGDAGKGFTVVAGEVKNLANQTAQATDKIADEISGIQSISNNVAESNSDVAAATEGVRAGVHAVASAIEEQTAVTNDITRNMQEIAQAIQNLNDCIKRIAA
jgi:methyl-accepting chemotaxis protein